MINEQFWLLWLPVPIVFLGEHLILTRYYKKPSSLQRLLNRSGSAKADMLMWVFYYLLNSSLGTIVSLLTLPGLAYVAVTWLASKVHWPGLLGALHITSFPLAWAIWLIVFDFSLYVAHVLMHKIPYLWNFHKLHHAATEMTIATGVRVSIAENFFNNLVSFVIAILILGLPNPHVAFAALLTWGLIDLVQHSDLPWDYGFLGYIIASPRFHRLHHSSEVEDHDANYGNIFSLWDYMFGTVGRRYKKNHAVADSCVLGLYDGQETEQINREWHTVLLHTTFLLPVLNFLRKKLREKSASACEAEMPVISQEFSARLPADDRA